ncbi:MAG: diiron oxygenase [Candidatus Acidiferrales bacterium]
MSATARAFILEETSVDNGKRFIPEEFTPLSYTQSYGQLTEGQRLRYNQLQALYFNEQIIFFEQVIGRKVLEALLRDSWPRRLEQGMREFVEEEREHTEMFRQLNQRCAPQFYATSDFYFIDPPRAWMMVLNGATRHPRFFTMFLWLMLVQEERSLFYSKKFIAQRGRLEPHFAETHRVHFADEVGHVHWDEELIEALWRRTNPLLRKMNARLFAWMLGEFFNAPKRAQLRVVRQLALEFPDLRGREAGMRRQLLDLSHDAQYQASLYSREIVPRAYALFDKWPEFRALENCGYRQLREAAR